MAGQTNPPSGRSVRPLAHGRPMTTAGPIAPVRLQREQSVAPSTAGPDTRGSPGSPQKNESRPEFSCGRRSGRTAKHQWRKPDASVEPTCSSEGERTGIARACNPCSRIAAALRWRGRKVPHAVSSGPQGQAPRDHEVEPGRRH